MPVRLLLYNHLKMPVSETDSKDKHSGGSREGDMEISENIQMRERREAGECTHRNDISVISPMEAGIVPFR